MTTTRIQNERTAIRKAHRVGTSMVVTLDPYIVRDMNIDETTFFSQEPADGAILMKIRRLTN